MEPYTKSVDVLSWFSEDDMGEFTEAEVSNIWSDKSPGYIILNESTGKILKSIKYTPANFSSLLN